jgi:hypothetical protein
MAPIESNESTSPMTEYAVITIVLMITFILLVHPTTSSYLEKYLPPVTNLKGCGIRAAILGVVYIITKVIMTYTKKS